MQEEPSSRVSIVDWLRGFERTACLDRRYFFLSEDFLAPSSDNSRMLNSATIIPLDFATAVYAEDVHVATGIESGVLGEDVCEV